MANEQLIGARADKIVSLRLRWELTEHEALNMAAFIVAIAGADLEDFRKRVEAASA